MAAQAESKSGSPTDLISRTRVSREMLGSIVQLKVGPKKQLFHIHKGLLCSAAAYFRAALEGGFKEAREQKIQMPEEDPAAFQRFQLWLYTGSLIELSANEEDRPTWHTIFSLYSMAERLGIPELQNDVIDTIIDLRYKLKEIAVGWADKVYSETMENSPLRRLLVRLLTESRLDLNDPEWIIRDLDHYPLEFLRDVILAQHEQLTARPLKSTDFKKHRKDFHVPVKT
ncbi:hypothetical protein G7Y79_00024g056450 [Physcia stellaris]|nr:hypothetical protein G7Y79_00024g056450 [Physcia stellaris]